MTLYTKHYASWHMNCECSTCGNVKPTNLGYDCLANGPCPECGRSCRVIFIELNRAMLERVTPDMVSVPVAKIRESDMDFDELQRLLLEDLTN